MSKAAKPGSGKHEPRKQVAAGKKRPGPAGKAIPAPRADRTGNAGQAPLPDQRPAPDPLIIGIGATTGGLDAFTTFLRHLPSDHGMAFVLLRDRAADRHDVLAELIGCNANMSVVKARDGEKVQARHVYVIPPEATLTIADGTLRMAPAHSASPREVAIGYDASHRITRWNRAAERMLGCHAAQAVGQRLEWLLQAAQVRDADTIIDACERPVSGTEIETEWRRRNGDSLSVLITASPLLDAEGRVTGGSLVVRDNTEHLRATRHTEMMLGELNHRVKNTLATVHAIAQQTLKQADNMQDFGKVFLSRLLALSSTHDLLARGAWRGVTLRDLVLAELTPFRNADHGYTEIDGDEARLDPGTTLALSMALHELTTNAAKYGALSVPAGSVSVRWQIHRRDDRPWLLLDWVERDGPPVRKPERTGFGHRLITDGLALELDGKVDLEFAPGGVTCHVEVPLHRGDTE